MSIRSASTSTIFPFPSSPHCEPTITTQLPLLISPEPFPSESVMRHPGHARAVRSLSNGCTDRARGGQNVRRGPVHVGMGPRLTHPVLNLRGGGGGCQPRTGAAIVTACTQCPRSSGTVADGPNRRPASPVDRTSCTCTCPCPASRL